MTYSITRAELLSVGKDGGTCLPDLREKYGIDLNTLNRMRKYATLLNRIEGAESLSTLKQALCEFITMETGVR